MNSVNNHLRETFLQCLYVALLVVVIFANAGGLWSHSETTHIDAPFLENKYAFSYEIAGRLWNTNPEDWIDVWFFGQEAPFKYRILAKIPIYLSYTTLTSFNIDHFEAFYSAYVLWTLIFLGLFLWFAARFVAEYLVLLESNLQPYRYRLFILAATVLACLPPVLYAFKFPVHGSPNDFLGYLLVALGLLSLIKARYGWFILWALLGVFCRETNAILLLPFLLVRDVALRKRLGVIAAVILVTVVYRALWQDSYNPLDAASHNLQYPLESMAFVFLAFGPVWVLGVMGHYARGTNQTAHGLVSAIHSSFYVAIVAVLLVVLLFARLREIRLEYVLWFYIVPYGIYAGYLGIRALKASRMIPVLVVAVVAATATTLLIANQLMPLRESEHVFLVKNFASFYGGFGGGWRTVFLAYFFMTGVVSVIAVYLCVQQFRMRK